MHTFGGNEGSPEVHEKLRPLYEPSFDESATYYEIMGVEEDATEAELRFAYRTWAKEFHPDKAPNNDPHQRIYYTEYMQLINQAYEVLNDQDQRDRYDIWLEEQRLEYSLTQGSDSSKQQSDYLDADGNPMTWQEVVEMYQAGNTPAGRAAARDLYRSEVQNGKFTQILFFLSAIIIPGAAVTLIFLHYTDMTFGEILQALGHVFK